MKKKILLSIMALSAVMSVGAQTSRELVLTDKEGNNITFPADQVDGIMFQSMPQYIKLNSAFNGGYEEVGPLGIYTVSFGTNVDSSGLPASSDDMVVQLVMAGPWSDDVRNPILPAGYYRIGRSEAEWTFDVTKSSIIVLTEDGPSPAMIIDGTVDVRRDSEGEYDIRMEFTTFSGAQVDMRYKGEVNLPAGFGDFQPFIENVDITFAGGQGRFWGNWYYPFAADLAMQFYQGTIEDDVLKDGYMLDISFYEPKPANEMDPNQRVADGTYTLETRDAVRYTYLPFRYEAGERVEYLGTEYITKTRLTYYAPDGSRKLGLIKGGTFTVSDNGTKFVFDFVTEEGISIKGSYSGATLLQNFCDNDVKAPQRPYSTLTENVALNWADGTVAIFYNEGKSILDDYNTMMLMLTHSSMNQGDYIEIDFFTESETVADGTYTVGDGLKVNHVIPGEIDYGRQMIFSWYGDLDEVDADGYNTKLGPITTGTVTISTQSDGKRKVVFNVKDDAGNSITGDYVGTFIDAADFAPAKSIRKRASMHRTGLGLRKGAK